MAMSCSIEFFRYEDSGRVAMNAMEMLFTIVSKYRAESF
jgi:hypothetical protein